MKWLRFSSAPLCFTAAVYVAAYLIERPLRRFAQQLD